LKIHGFKNVTSKILYNVSQATCLQKMFVAWQTGVLRIVFRIYIRAWDAKPVLYQVIHHIKSLSNAIKQFFSYLT